MILFVRARPKEELSRKGGNPRMEEYLRNDWAKENERRDNIEWDGAKYRGKREKNVLFTWKPEMQSRNANC